MECCNERFDQQEYLNQLSCLYAEFVLVEEDENYIVDFGKALFSLNTDFANPCIARAQAYSEEERWHDTKVESSIALQLLPKNINALLLQVRANIGLKRWQTAFDLIATIVDSSIGIIPNELSVHCNIRFDTVFAALEEISDKITNDEEFLLCRARVLIALCRPTDAFADFDLVIKQNLPSNAQLTNWYLWRAHSLEMLGHVDDAISDFSAILSFDSTNGPALARRAALYKKLEKWELAMNDSRKQAQIRIRQIKAAVRIQCSVRRRRACRVCQVESSMRAAA